MDLCFWKRHWRQSRVFTRIAQIMAKNTPSEPENQNAYNVSQIANVSSGQNAKEVRRRGNSQTRDPNECFHRAVTEENELPGLRSGPRFVFTALPDVGGWVWRCVSVWTDWAGNMAGSQWSHLGGHGHAVAIGRVVSLSLSMGLNMC